MSRYIAKYINLEKSKRPIFWNVGSILLQASKNRTSTHVCGSWAASSADSRSPAVEPAGADDVAADRFLFPRRKLKASKWIDIEEYMHKHTKKQRPFLLALLHKDSASSFGRTCAWSRSWRRASVRAPAGVVYWGCDDGGGDGQARREGC